jgi:AcrR family transcriptional regulator
MDGFERRKEQSKEDIRKAAEELFSKFGAGKVSINDIARKAGVSQATIYNNFGSKEELVHDYRKSIVSLVSGRFREILVWKKSYVERFQGFLQSWIDIADRYNIATSDRESANNREARGTVETKKSQDSINQEIENTFLEFIREGKEQGHISSDISDEAIITYIKFFQEGVSNHTEIQNRMRRDSKLSQDLLALFVYGISGKNNAVNSR